MSLKEVNEKLADVEAQRSKFVESLHYKWVENGGCKKCNGEGRILTWWTLDGPSWNEYGTCPEQGCTGETRKKSGLNPTGASFWYSTWPDKKDITRVELYDQEIATLKDECSSWKNLRKGVEVTVKRNSRAKGSAPEGTVCIIVSSKDGTYGVTYYLKDIDGNFYRSPPGALEITNPNPGWSPPEQMTPIIVIPRKTKWGVVLNLLASKGEQKIWPNNIYVDGQHIEKCHNIGGETKLITSNGNWINIVPDQSFPAEMTSWMYDKIIEGTR